MAEPCVGKMFVATIMCCFSLILAMAEVDEDYPDKHANAEASPWLPQSIRDSYVENSLSNEYVLPSGASQRDATNNVDRQMATPPKGMESWVEAFRNPKTKRFSFWKRAFPFSDGDRFWKRQVGDRTSSTFWKRSYRPTKVWSRFGSDANQNMAFWKRSQTEQDMSDDWNKRSDGGSPFDEDQVASPDRIERPGVDKRSGMPLSLMMFPRYMSTHSSLASPRQDRRPKIRWMIKTPSESKQTKDSQTLSLQMPPKNRRQGPKLNPDFNPTGW